MTQFFPLTLAKKVTGRTALQVVLTTLPRARKVHPRPLGPNCCCLSPRAGHPCAPGPFVVIHRGQYMYNPTRLHNLRNRAHDMDAAAQGGWAAPVLTPSPLPVCVTYDRRQTAADATAAQQVFTVLLPIQSHETHAAAAQQVFTVLDSLSLHPSIPPSFHPSLHPSIPPSLPPSIPPSLPPSHTGRRQQRVERYVKAARAAP